MQKFPSSVLTAAKLLAASTALVLVVYGAGRSNVERPAGPLSPLPDIQSSNPVLLSPDAVLQTATTTASGGNYIFELARQADSAGDTLKTSLRVLQKGQIAYAVNDARFIALLDQPPNSHWAGEFKNAGDIATYGLRDITGDGIPELALLGFSNGAHCCTTAHIVELGDAPRVLMNRALGDDVKVQLIDTDGDGIMEIQTTDDVFDYWHTGHAGSPFPQVWLRFDAKKQSYIVALELMKKSAPSKATLKERADVWTSAGWEGYESALNTQELTKAGYVVPWGYALELIYSGNSEAVKEYIDLAWRENKEFTSK
ncbi:MAG: hypothetical protein HY984_02045, partial [Candidatus Magasanikbacteria bacterium]|nr:hypothetical protein [Candidatus Magasanikbacteria bacterium]